VSVSVVGMKRSRRLHTRERPALAPIAAHGNSPPVNS
jgi:hypothetical protein